MDLRQREITVDIRQLLRQENVNHYRIGLLYNHAVEHELAQARGYKDAPSYFADHLQEISRATLAMYGAVADDFEEAVCMRYGVTCLSLLLTYEELVSNAVRHGRPPVLVQVTTSARAWFIDVSDGAGDEAPTPAVDRDPAHGGLGLHVVARLTSEHGWSVEGSLKHVWARVERSATRS